jgi:hypothetical protein
MSSFRQRCHQFFLVMLAAAGLGIMDQSDSHALLSANDSSKTDLTRVS